MGVVSIKKVNKFIYRVGSSMLVIDSFRYIFSFEIGGESLINIMHCRHY